MKDLYAAPKPPRRPRPKAPTPHAPGSGQFVSKDPINDRDVHEFAANFGRALHVVLEGLTIMSKAVQPGSPEARAVEVLGRSLGLIGASVHEGLTVDVGRSLGRFPPVPGKED